MVTTQHARALAQETCRLLASGRPREPAARGEMLPSPPPAQRRSPRAAAAGRTRIACVAGASFEAAQWLYAQRGCRRVCVLDFASDSCPGGGWRGNQVGTQEESLCRASSLGVALEKLAYPIPEFGMAHVPEVLVLRGADGALLATPFRVGVLAAALRDVGGDGDPDPKQRAHLERKVDGVLAAMAAFGYDGVVLGSWGCGAFGNSHTLVANAFASALATDDRFATAFDHVAFADPRAAGQAAFWQAMRPLGAERVTLLREAAVKGVQGVKLLPHERELLERGELKDVTHAGASAVWLSAESTVLPPGDAASGGGGGDDGDGRGGGGGGGGGGEGGGLETVYRPMGDPECAYLLQHRALPATQPYQTIVRGEEGRAYAERYLRGTKKVDTSPTTVVEFVCPRGLVEGLFARQCKPEHGALSHGLGDKGGKGLPEFNASLASGAASFRIVLVKRSAR